MRSSEAEGLQPESGSRNSRTRPLCRNIVPLHSPQCQGWSCPRPRLSCYCPTSCWLRTKQLWVDILPLSTHFLQANRKDTRKEGLVWAVNKMEQSKAALCPVPKFCLTWTSKFLIWLFSLVQLLLAGTELQNEMKITWLHFRMSVSRLLQIQ